MKKSKVKSTVKNKRKIIRQIPEKDIKHTIYNTPIPLIITHSGELHFKMTAAEYKRIEKSEKLKIKYSKDLADSLAYIVAEGFIDQIK